TVDGASLNRASYSRNGSPQNGARTRRASRPRIVDVSRFLAVIMAKKKAKAKDVAEPIVVGDWKNEVKIYYNDRSESCEAIRCRQCKGHGWYGCGGMGFLVQIALPL